MDDMIKASADSGDLITLKYIFVDALEADPTFVRYEEEYSYCKSIPGLLEPHQELMPFSRDPVDWDEEYWTGLKMDLLRNFSDVRMRHMKDVAQVFLAEKVSRILKERAADQVNTAQEQKPKAAEPVSEMAVIAPKATEPVDADIPVRNDPEIIRAEMERRRQEIYERRRDEALRLGAEAIQIVSDSRYIFKLTDSHQCLIRYQFSGEAGGNEVTGFAMFRYVPGQDPRVLELRQMYKKRVNGQYSTVKGARYQLFALIEESNQERRKVAGYKLVRQTGIFQRQQTELYYVHEPF